MIEYVLRDVEAETVLLLEASARDAYGDGTVRDGRAEDRHARLVARSQDAIVRGYLCKLAAQKVKELARRIGARLVELVREAADPFVGLAVLFVARQNVPHAADLRRLKLGVGHRRMSLKVLAAQGFMQVLKEHRAGTDHHINEAVLDDVGQKAAHPRRDERAVGRDHHGRIVAEHIEPDAMRFGELPRAKARALHFFEQAGDRAVAVNLYGPDGRGQVLRGSRFTLSNHIFSNDEW